MQIVYLFTIMVNVYKKSVSTTIAAYPSGVMFDLFSFFFGHRRWPTSVALGDRRDNAIKLRSFHLFITRYG